MKMKVYDESVLVNVERDGVSLSIPFYEIAEGDYVPMLSCHAGAEAHQCEDPDYDGWVFYDTNWNSWFPEDVGGELIYDPDEDEDDEEDEW